MRNPQHPLLALDPGFRDLGYAVLVGDRILTNGVAALRLLPRKQRASEVRRLLRHWLASYGPRTLVLERTHAQPRLTFHKVHELATVAARWAKRHGLAVATYAPQTVRKHLVGNGKATKREVAVAVAGRFPSLRVYVTQDRQWKERFWQNMFDAIALGLHHQGYRPPAAAHAAERW